MTVRQFSMSFWQAALAAAITLAFIAPFNAHSQTFTLLHAFTGGADGSGPYAGLTWDGGANFYGTATEGGYTGTTCYDLDLGTARGCGTVYRLHRSGSSWSFSTIYEFRGGTVDGNFPMASLTMARDGSLYGTTFAGHYNGSGDCQTVGLGRYDIGCGIVFNLRPPASACTTALCYWTETISYALDGTNQDGGAGSGLGRVTFDQAGNLYDVTLNSVDNSGEVFQIVPSGGSWVIGKTYWVLPQGDAPLAMVSNLSVDSQGNVYGTSQMGPQIAPNCGQPVINGCGTVYQLLPTLSGSGWNANVIYQFTGGADGKFPVAGVVADAAGNLYGVSSTGGPNSGGTVFELLPSSGGWTYQQIYALPDGNPQEASCLLTLEAPPGCSGPWGNLVLDAAGNIYGAGYGNGAHQSGNVFKLTRSNGSWTYTDLYDFTGGNDGANPVGPLTLDNSGNIYGTTVRGGSKTNCFYGCGTVFEITP